LNTSRRFVAALLAAALSATLPAHAASADSPELERMFRADQAARMPEEGKQIDWQKTIVDDARRRKRVWQLIRAKALATSADFGRAALILQHGCGAGDFLMAHDLAVIAVIKGEQARARWLAAATLDRYLRAIGLPQRYGTQSVTYTGRPAQLEPVDPEVPDFLRREMAVPPLAQALDHNAPAPTPEPKSAQALAAASAELKAMAGELDAELNASGARDWTALAARAETRRARVKALLADGLLASAADFHHAARVAGGGYEPGDQLTAHDLAVIAIGKGEPRAALTAAEAMDSFLERVERPQRYGTVIEERYPDPPRLYPLDAEVPDFIRLQYGAPTLSVARKREAEAVRKARKTKTGIGA
jgi:hypothetical protein